MWTKILDVFVTHLFRKGDFSLTYPDGTTRRYGNGGTPSAAITLHDPALPRKIIMAPELAVGEAYMDGTLTIVDDDLRSFLTLAVSNMAAQGKPWFHRPLDIYRQLSRYINQFNPAKRARANVAHHYDLSGELYDLFLDEDRQYSCAYFARPDMTLEQAQAAKKRHIADKLLLKPGMRVLDIGCGWGGMALTLARDYGAEVVGVTLSKEQHALASRRAAEAGLSDKVKFHLMDYRSVTGTFDRIVSVGMFEHVGVPHYREYFRTVHDLLAEDGVALIHTIGQTDEPGATNPWILKYIFPGGYCPSLSEATRAIEVNALHTCDIEVWRLHYAETLRHWYDRFMANIDRVRELYDDRFCRMWRYYLIACEATFRHNSQVVFQFQLSRQQDAVPLTRDYLYSEDAAKELRHAAE
ncbi:cyclopropane-fatty-acyl-phospholipid synthase [Roseovarius sp. SK2]|uniref:SAM-dependent methyltransferase n=1 Tax=Roseovarius TaxID=74030 RepID=UPI00237A1C50|nr:MULTISPECIES: cyclopropane-fatty-acyl-phospholipid synthase family protein [unclassified Roseovarius]MDD9724989.1 cyclopropane-fatty-acyl-phospholipid synthase [Roseovarius sp. SK2]